MIDCIANAYPDAEMTYGLTNTLELVSVKVEKVWEGDAAWLESRPESITVKMTRDVDGKSWTAELTEANGWTAQWDRLPKYILKDDELTQVTYTVEETNVPDDYAVSYTVEGGEASETAPELKPVTEASFKDATAEVTVTNILKTFDIAATKHWIGDSATEGQDLRPDAVELTLQRKVRGEDDSAFTAVPGVTPAWLNADTAHNSWVASWTDLPAYAETADGRMDYIYRVVETKVPDNYEVIYTGEGGAIPGIDAAEALENDLAQVEITNKLKPVSITLTKKWLGDEILYELTRPEDLTVKLYRSISGGAAEEVTADADGAALDLTAFTGKDTGVWSITIDNLPVYDANRKPYTYWMEETVPDAYAAKDDGVTARVDATEHIGDTISLEMENTLRTTGLTARKTWSNDNDWTDAYRPATLMLTLEYTIAQNPAEDDWTKADALVIAATPRSAERTETVSGDEIAVYTWEYLPAYILTGDNSHAAVTYRVKETVVPYGYEATYSDDDEGDKIVHNALEICELKSSRPGTIRTTTTSPDPKASP